MERGMDGGDVWTEREGGRERGGWREVWRGRTDGGGREEGKEGDGRREGGLREEGMDRRMADLCLHCPTLFFIVF